MGLFTCLKNLPDEYLKELFVPNVYQKNIYDIYYELLKAKGIKMISFDIDDTITPIENPHLNSKAIKHIEYLKGMGFYMIILTNATDDRGERYGRKLGLDYIDHADKPNTIAFKKAQKKYLENCGKDIIPEEMVHIGNDIICDVMGGNRFGVVTCLVRNVGIIPRMKRFIFKTDGQKVRSVLKERGIWRKHHKYVQDDQYYQLDEIPHAQEIGEKMNIDSSVKIDKDYLSRISEEICDELSADEEY